MWPSSITCKCASCLRPTTHDLICSHNHPSQGQSPVTLTVPLCRGYHNTRDDNRAGRAASAYEQTRRERESTEESEREVAVLASCVLAGSHSSALPIQFHYQNDDDDDDDVSCMKHKFIFKCCLSCSGRSCERTQLSLSLVILFVHFGLGCICSSFFSFFFSIFFLSFFSSLHFIWLAAQQRAALHLLVEVFFLGPFSAPPQGRVLQLTSFSSPSSFLSSSSPMLIIK